MVHSCSANNCTERHVKGGISFHSFPKKEELRQEWVTALKRQNFKPSDHSKLCAKHFIESDYLIHFGQRLLKPNAVPSVFDFSNHLLKQVKKKKTKKKAKKRKKPQYTSVRAIKSEKLNSEEAKNVWEIASKHINKYRKTIQALRAKQNSLRKKVNSLKELIKPGKKPAKVSAKVKAKCADILQNTASISHNQPTPTSAKQETTSSSIEQIDIKEEPLEMEYNEYKLYHVLRSSVKEKLFYKENDSESETEHNICTSPLSIKEEPIVNEESSDSSEFDNEVIVNHENIKTENDPLFEYVYIKEESCEEDFN